MRTEPLIAGDINGLHPGLLYYFKGMLPELFDDLWTLLEIVNWVWAIVHDIVDASKWQHSLPHTAVADLVLSNKFLKPPHWAPQPGEMHPTAEYYSFRSFFPRFPQSICRPKLLSTNDTLLLCVSLGSFASWLRVAASIQKNIVSTSLRLPLCRAPIRRPGQVSSLLREIQIWLRKLGYGWEDAAHRQSLSGEEYGGVSWFSNISARPIPPTVDLANRSKHFQRWEPPFPYNYIPLQAFLWYGTLLTRPWQYRHSWILSIKTISIIGGNSYEFIDDGSKSIWSRD